MHIRHVINTHHNHIYTIIESVIQKESTLDIHVLKYDTNSSEIKRSINL